MPAFAPIVPEMAVSIHTGPRGVQLYQFPPGKDLSLRWTRTLRDTSTCDIQVPSLIVENRLPDIQHWLHWMSVWAPDDPNPLWTGPIRTIGPMNDKTMNIGARDPSAFYERTRTPMTKRWEATDVAYIAEEFWQRMIEHHGLRGRPIVRADPNGKPFDYQATADAGMVGANIEELVQLGLRWCVVRGVAILGPAPLKPVAALGREHFTDPGPSITRDGSQMFNDVLVRAPENVARAVADMGGLNLQTIVNRDNMFGQINVNKAALELARYSAAPRDVLTLPGGAALAPGAPVTLDMLIPSTRVTIEAYGLQTLQELTGLEVTAAPGAAEAKVTMASVNDNPPELLDSTAVTS